MAGGDLTKFEAVLKMETISIFMKLKYDMTEREYQDRYSEIMKKKTPTPK